MPNEEFLQATNQLSMNVPERPLVCIEHPGVVRNTENAINTLGGDYIIGKVRLKRFKQGSYQQLTAFSCFNQQTGGGPLGYHGDQMIL